MKTIAQQLNVKDFPFTIKNSKEDVIYSENSKGYWSKREYDANGNQVYYENSKGFWYRSEFDSNNNEVYYENSKGSIEDNRNIPEYTMEELAEKIGNFKLKINHGNIKNQSWNCKGKGGVEAFGGCFIPAQHCCGGCTETVKCIICNGEGTQEIDFFNEVKGIVHDDGLTPEEVFKQLKSLLKEIKEFM